MRHNDARKWLHAVLDLLPVLLIPVFMIYSHRHTMTQQTSVDIQYKYQSNEVNDLDDLVEGNLYIFEGDDTFNIYLSEEYDFTLQIIKYDSLSMDNSSLEFDEIILESYFNEKDTIFTINYSSQNLYLSFINNENVISFVDTDFDYFFTNLYFIVVDGIDSFKTTHNDFFTDLPQYNDYNVIESVEVYDETSSVMNVFMDDFNGAVNKYFNMGNVFNLNRVYQWFNSNIFGGNAPTIIYSVWNIALYELVMDLLFLLYGLFMWFIDMCQHLMEKPFRSIK